MINPVHHEPLGTADAGDFGCNNMLAADGHVTGVLDWEAATIGDRLIDISGRFWATHPAGGDLRDPAGRVQ